MNDKTTTKKRGIIDIAIIDNTTAAVTSCVLSYEHNSYLLGYVKVMGLIKHS